MPNQPEVSADTVGNFGQCSKSVASVKVVDGVPSSASMGLTMGFQGYDSGKADPIHEVLQVGIQVRDVGKAISNHEVVQFQLHESIDRYSDSNRDKGVDGEVAILGFGVGKPCAMQCEVSRGDGDWGFATHGYSVSRGSSDRA